MVLIEEPLSGGNATDAVVRVGRTVRKPWTASAASVHALLAAVREADVPAPRPRGRDERGRQRLEFVPGEIAMLAAPLTSDGLARVGRLIRSIHDACATFTPPEDACWDVLIPAEDEELVCHNDLAPWNLVLGDRWVFIDWDGAGPSTRRWDLAYAAQAFTLNDVAQDPAAAGTRLRALVDGYGPDAALRAALPTAVGERATAMRDLLRGAQAEGREPWATMHDDGHGEHWTAAAEYAVAHREVWAAALA
jgi:hypothetical protein